MESTSTSGSDTKTVNSRTGRAKNIFGRAARSSVKSVNEKRDLTNDKANRQVKKAVTVLPNELED